MEFLSPSPLPPPRKIIWNFKTKKQKEKNMGILKKKKKKSYQKHIPNNGK